MAPFDSFPIAPMEYKLPKAVGASLPPKMTLALSVMLTAVLGGCVEKEKKQKIVVKKRIELFFHGYC